MKYIVEWLFANRYYIERVRESIVNYEYEKTEANLTNIVKETYRLARYYKDTYQGDLAEPLGVFLHRLQHNTGADLTMVLYDYQLWLNDRVRSKIIAKWVYTVKNFLRKKN